MAVEQGDILNIGEFGGTQAYCGIALKDGNPQEVPVRMLNGETVRLNGDSEYKYINKTGETANVFIEKITNQIESIATEEIEREITQEVAGEILEYTIEKMADAGQDMQTATRQAVEEVLKNNPKLLNAVTHEKLPEIAEFVFNVLRDAMMP